MDVWHARLPLRKPRRYLLASGSSSSTLGSRAAVLLARRCKDAWCFAWLANLESGLKGLLYGTGFVHCSSGQETHSKLENAHVLRMRPRQAGMPDLK